jgi:2,4-dienoyl-CoA reductase-like NADH-dependent reductase (Old Yellow Enzyme family)
MLQTRSYLTTGKIGSLTLKNRIIRAATSETMATVDGAVTDQLVELYTDLAKGGAGLIITGHMDSVRRDKPALTTTRCFRA